ncbi:hypothetical protein BV22DRAFT_910998 [Leucogyrophana mollusca]|uniref:Uncharacterized protein n=1 Tax=Leucogyrophana mollusca TaxID=85980 RepID=A0ACB8B0G1_9AGAM|nr:hypothetical protein BV22DRAFT_910998 [Leucogyrophana mollusca]
MHSVRFLSSPLLSPSFKTNQLTPHPRSYHFSSSPNSVICRHASPQAASPSRPSHTRRHAQPLGPGRRVECEYKRVVPMPLWAAENAGDSSR